MEAEIILRVVLIGIGATVVMDLWSLFLKALGMPTLDYAMVGRWLGHFRRGRFSHDGIGKAAPVPGERALGWIAHYAIGIIFAFLLIALWGPGWAREPSLLPALATGVLTVVMPFFIMQPAFGLGIAAAKTPRPNFARLLSLAAHAFFGIGLYVAALLLVLLIG